MRLYHDLGPNHPKAKALCKLTCEKKGGLLDLCDVGEAWGYTAVKNASDMFPMLWRFLPSLDKQVCVTITEQYLISVESICLS